jgi:hypothetical protein
VKDVIAFAAGGWAFRMPERAVARALVCDTLVAARAGGWWPTHGNPLLEAFAIGEAAGGRASLATPVVAAAFAATIAARAPGATLLDAVVAGTEVALRVDSALRGHAARGWDARGSAGRLGAALAAGRALGLSRDALRDAFDLAATAAGGLVVEDASATAFVIGSAATDGVEAALLARAGMTAAPHALEGRRGLAALMSDGLDAEGLLAGLGATFRLHALAVGVADAPDALRTAVDELSSAPSLDTLIAAARA